MVTRKGGLPPSLDLTSMAMGSNSDPGPSPTWLRPFPFSSLAAASQLEHKAREEISPNHMGHFLKNWFLFNRFSWGTKKNMRGSQIVVPAGSCSGGEAGLKGQMPLERASIFNPSGEMAASVLLYEMKWPLRERQINRSEMLLTQAGEQLLAWMRGPESTSINSCGSSSLKVS